jgi:hypothetical protein
MKKIALMEYKELLIVFLPLRRARLIVIGMRVLDSKKVNA